jgi:glycosyltransferase involved in cell wall biosynthesis
MGRLRTPLARGRTFSALWDQLAIRRKELKAKRVGKPPQDPRFSIVSAVYNVEKYLDDFFSSIVLQPEFLGQIQVIVVNDGSTDRSLDILNAWRRRFPHNITVVSKENGGQASARNLGMTYATGEWITFIDPDDFVSRSYFSEINTFIDVHERCERDLALLSCNMVYFREESGLIKDNHPLRYRFAKDAVLRVHEPGRYIQLSAATALFRRSIAERANLKFDDRVKPAFEDAHFVARFMMECGDSNIGFAKNPIYYYRKRLDGSSTLDSSARDPRRYDNLFRFGHIPLLSRAAQLSDGPAPVWLQRTVLYDVVWQFKELLDNAQKLSFLTESQRLQYRELLTSVFKYIERQTIETFELAGIWEMYRIGILQCFKGERLSTSRVIIDTIDSDDGTITLRWFSASQYDRLVARLDGRPALELERGCQTHTFLGEPFAYEHRRRLLAPFGSLTVNVDGVPVNIECKGCRRSKSIDIRRASSAVEKHLKTSISPSTSQARIRAIGTSIASRTRFADCWVLMDRDTQADDNAEHLYRHLMRCRPDVNAFFVLRRNSHDWKRLETEGFRLLEFASEAHDAALINAKYLISSHVDRYVVDRLPLAAFGDLLRFKYVFLQHGVTKDDISHWLNTKPIALMISATYAEYLSLAEQISNYKFMPSEVAITGFPRHDALLRNTTKAPKRLLIMPTWRESAVAKSTGNGNARSINEDFMSTEYARAWHSIIQSHRLKDSLLSNGFECLFFPHANIQPYLAQFNVPSHIQIMRHDARTSIQDLFYSSSVLLTDYSSVAFEMAYLWKPVIYYQFDYEQVFSGGHLTRKGYYDYERDGFGPVCFDEATVLNAIDESLRSGGGLSATYRQRALTAFAWRDGKCCARVVEAIERIGRWPRAEDGPLHFDIPPLRRRERLERIAASSLSECGY